MEPEGGKVAVTPPRMVCSPQKGGLGWSKSALVTIDGTEAFAKFGGGGQGDVPTVRGAAIIPDGGSAVWTVKIVKKFRAGAPMRVGVQKPEVVVGQNWSDKGCIDKAWYLDSNGEMYNGKSPINETEEPLHTGDVLTVQLSERTLTFSLRDRQLPGNISGVTGEVQLAVQLFTKGDRVALVDQEVGDAAEAQVSFEKTEEGGELLPTCIDLQVLDEPPEAVSTMEEKEEEKEEEAHQPAAAPERPRPPPLEVDEPEETHDAITPATPHPPKAKLCGCC